MNLNFNITSKASPSGNHAFPKGSEISITLSADVQCQSAWFYLGNDERVFIQREIEVTNQASSFSCAVLLTEKDFPTDDGLYFCHFEFISNGIRYYTAFDHSGNCYADTRFVNEAQMLIYNEKYSSPEWLKGSVMYQIFPDRFAKGGECEKREDAIYNDDWENGIPEYPAVRGDSFPNNTHFGGSLYGVAEKLPYLKELGIGCIYLNPIFSAYSNHKYDTADFMSVDKSFGGDSALAHLIEQAHKMDIKVILDGVFNHVGNDSIYFDAYNKYGCGACSAGKSSPYYEWFTFNEFPNVYESWWGIKNLPRTVRCESYISFITEQVIPKYMQMGIDGWRLDVADELESDFLDRIVSAIKAYKPDAVIIGEVWEDASNKIAYDERKRYFRGAQLDSVTDYPIRNAMIDFVKYGNAEFLVETVKTLYRNYPPHKLFCVMNFLGSHDTERIATVLGGIEDMGEENEILAHRRMSEGERENAIKLLNQAYLLLASLPGVPCIYYGDEFGMEGYHDPFNRRPFPPRAFDDANIGFFKKVNAVRNGEPLFKSTELTATVLSEGVAYIVRTDGVKKLHIFANMSERVYTASGVYGRDLMTDEEIQGALALARQQVRIIKEGK
ncbi:MAG: glycoside hydrolase family 13 protein [Clostridia bacterium]|nr:glycoside hydrolase family 13 protein [Clostridia bacterium]